MKTPAEFITALEAMISGHAEYNTPGPTKWCKQCSRYHKARADCGLAYVKRTAKSGNEVWRWAHV